MFRRRSLESDTRLPKIIVCMFRHCGNGQIELCAEGKSDSEFYLPEIDCSYELSLEESIETWLNKKMCDDYKKKIYPVSVNSCDFYKPKNSSSSFVFIRIDVGKVEKYQKALNWITQESIIKIMTDELFFKKEHQECLRRSM